MPHRPFTFYKRVTERTKCTSYITIETKTIDLSSRFSGLRINFKFLYGTRKYAFGHCLLHTHMYNTKRSVRAALCACTCDKSGLGTSCCSNNYSRQTKNVCVFFFTNLNCTRAHCGNTIWYYFNCFT